jgi:hypothetical protein
MMMGASSGPRLNFLRSCVCDYALRRLIGIVQASSDLIVESLRNVGFLLVVFAIDHLADVCRSRAGRHAIEHERWMFYERMTARG